MSTKTKPAGGATPTAGSSTASDVLNSITSPFQVMPDLAPDEYEALKADIATRGVVLPVLIDEDGNVLDGHHRKRIGEELGFDVPHEIRAGLTTAEKLDLALSLNLNRRHLTREQRRDLVERYLKTAPDKSDLQIAKATGVSDKTVTARRRELEARSEIPNVAAKVDTKGRQQPARQASANFATRVAEVMKQYDDAEQFARDTRAAIERNGGDDAIRLRISDRMPRFRGDVIRMRSELKAISSPDVLTGLAKDFAPLALSLLRACVPALPADQRQSMLRDSGLSDDVAKAVAQYEEDAAQAQAEIERWRTLAASKGVISKEELGILRSALHPDRVPSEKTRSDAMSIINRIDSLIAPAAVPARRRPKTQNLPSLRNLVEAKEERDLQKRDKRKTRAAQRRAATGEGSAS